MAAADPSSAVIANNPQGETAVQKFLGVCAATNEGAGTVGAVASLAQQLFHTKSSSIPSGFLKGIGWSHLSASMIIDKNHFLDFNVARDACVEMIEMRIPFMKPIDQPAAQDMVKNLRRGAVQKHCYGINIQFQNKQAEWIGFYAVLKPSTLSNGTPSFLFSWGELKAKGTQSVDYMLITHSKSSFFRDKTWTELVALPSNNKGITPEDTLSLLGIVGPLAEIQFVELSK